MNDEGVCRTATAGPGLLNIYKRGIILKAYFYIRQKTVHSKYYNFKLHSTQDALNSTRYALHMTQYIQYT